MSLALPPYVQALLKPEAYPQRPASVELLQTQMSFIFIAGDYTYKTKKPVNLGYLDYTTLEQREKLCRQELELNRRLSPGAYLSVVPVSETEGGFQLGGTTNIIEYAVKMKTLPRQRMMDVLLPANRVTPDMLKQVAVKMADFHSRAATDERISSFGSLEAVRVNTDENFDQTEKYIGKIFPAGVFHFIKEHTNSFINDNKDLLVKRAATGKIRDCHGDLHAQHICFAGDDIYIYDCIEFNERFRFCDVASEIAFLAMDIDRYGRADLSRAFVDAYIEASGDQGIAQLLDFYKCYRAYVRGKVACFKYDDPYLKDKEALRAEAGLYFNLAYKYANRKPCLFIVTGLIGTGKTTMAERISHSVGCAVLSSDVIRKQLAGSPLTERHYDGFSSGLYSPEFTQQTYEAMFKGAREKLAQGQSVILDASFKKKADRQAAQKLAEASGAGFLVVECTASEDSIKQRLEARQRKGSVSDGRWEIFAEMKKDFDAVNEFQEINHLVLDTVNSSGNINALLLERLTLL
jgi:aminoglycoside phosphotransferase family enzyme/predicted kinase